MTRREWIQSIPGLIGLPTLAYTAWKLPMFTALYLLAVACLFLAFAAAGKIARMFWTLPETKVAVTSASTSVSVSDSVVEAFAWHCPCCGERVRICVNVGAPIGEATCPGCSTPQHVRRASPV